MKIDRILVSALITGIVIGAVAVSLVDARREVPILASLAAALRK